MHFILFAIIIILLLVIVTQNTKPAKLEGSSAQNSTDRTHNRNTTDGASIAFIANGNLFVRPPGGETQQISSPFIQKILNEQERRNSLHGWKKGTSLESSFVGKTSDLQSETAAMQFKTADFLDEHTLVYFLSDGRVGGLFEQNLKTGEEQRLLHQQNLILSHFRFDVTNDRILCSAGTENGIYNLAAISRKNYEITHYTEGDTIDALPCDFPGQPQKVVMQSSGIGRNEAGHMLAAGPASLNVLSTDTQQLEVVVENDEYDFMHPVVHPNGDLFYIRRPYETPNISATNLFLDVALFPFRIARAFFHYLNFFSLMYSQKPLTSAAGPELQRDRKEIVIQGKRIDAEKAQRQAGVLHGVPSLVPKAWQLVSRNQYGAEVVLANHVLSFDISKSGSVIFTNGFGVYEIREDGPTLLFRETLIENVLVN